MPITIHDSINEAERVLVECKDYIWAIKEEIESINQSLQADSDNEALLSRKAFLLSELQTLIAVLNETRLNEKIREAKNFVSEKMSVAS